MLGFAACANSPERSGISVDIRGRIVNDVQFGNCSMRLRRDKAPEDATAYRRIGREFNESFSISKGADAFRVEIGCHGLVYQSDLYSVDSQTKMIEVGDVTLVPPMYR